MRDVEIHGRKAMGMTKDEAHIGRFDMGDCRKLLRAVQKDSPMWLHKLEGSSSIGT